MAIIQVPPNNLIEKNEWTPGIIPTWSYSTLKLFEKCPYKLYVQKILGLKDEGNKYTQRGSKIHEAAEKFVTGELDTLPKDLKRWEGPIKQLREMSDRLIVEDEWGFNIDWQPTGWHSDDVWLRAKLDVLIPESDTSYKIIDYKTGRPPSMVGLEHSEQAILYAIATFFRFPEAEYVTTEWWYVDHGQDTKLVKSFTREQAMHYWPGFDRRAKTMTSADLEAFAPNAAPNGLPKYVVEFLSDPENYPEDGPFEMPEWAKV